MKYLKILLLPGLALTLLLSNQILPMYNNYANYESFDSSDNSSNGSEEENGGQRFDGYESEEEGELNNNNNNYDNDEGTIDNEPAKQVISQCDGLCHAIQLGYTDEQMQDLLMSYDTNINDIDPITHSTAINLACEKGRVKLVSELLLYNADVNILSGKVKKEEYKESPLENACMSGKTDIVKAILEKCSNETLNKKFCIFNFKYLNPFVYCLEHKKTDLVLLLAPKYLPNYNQEVYLEFERLFDNFSHSQGNVDLDREPYIKYREIFENLKSLNKYPSFNLNKNISKNKKYDTKIKTQI